MYISYIHIYVGYVICAYMLYVFSILILNIYTRCVDERRVGRDVEGISEGSGGGGVGKDLTKDLVSVAMCSVLYRKLCLGFGTVQESSTSRLSYLHILSLDAIIFFYEDYLLPLVCLVLVSTALATSSYAPRLRVSSSSSSSFPSSCID